MRRFRFRLEALRRLAEAAESIERMELGASELALVKAEAHRDANTERARAARVALEEAVGDGDVPLEALRLVLRQIDDAGLLVTSAETAVEGARADAESQRESLREKSTERRVLDKVRDRSQVRHDDAARRREELEMDERAARAGEAEEAT